MQDLWDSVDVDRSGNLKLEEVAVVMAKMNITCSKENLRKQFEKCVGRPPGGEARASTRCRQAAHKPPRSVGFGSGRAGRRGRLE